MLAMPPSRAPLTGSFSVSDENNVVVCPLRNHDGSACRKRCTGVSLSRVPCAKLRHGKLHRARKPMLTCSIGEEVSFHAGTHSQGAS